MARKRKSPAKEADEALKLLEERYGKGFVAHAAFPKFMGRMDMPDGYAAVTWACGDHVEIFLKAQGGKVREARFTTDGCAASVAALNAALDLVTGKPVAEARALTGERVLEHLGGLPEQEEHCAHLAARSVRSAAADLERSEREPWRKLYRKF